MKHAEVEAKIKGGVLLVAGVFLFLYAQLTPGFQPFSSLCSGMLSAFGVGFIMYGGK